MTDSTTHGSATLLLAVLLFSCGQAARDEALPRAEEAPTDFDSGSSPPRPHDDGFASSIGEGLDACSSASSRRNVSLVRQPEVLTLFRFVGPSDCESLDRSSLLRNTGIAPLRIVGLAFDQSVFMANLALPVIVQPGEALSVPMRFSGEENIGTTMTVATDAGCRAFGLSGVTGEDGLFDFSAAAVDFGGVPIGGNSEPQSFTFQLQLGGELAATDFDQIHFGTAPEDVFDIVAGPQSPVQAISCAPIELQLRFRAPKIPGPVTGQLGYSIGAGDGWLELYGRAIPD